VIGPTIMAGLLILIVLVVGVRRLLGQEGLKQIDPRPERAVGMEAHRKPEHQTHTPRDQAFAKDRADEARRRRA
jgi:hypothetical protein